MGVAKQVLNGGEVQSSPGKERNVFLQVMYVPAREQRSGRVGKNRRASVSMPASAVPDVEHIRWQLPLCLRTASPRKAGAESVQEPRGTCARATVATPSRAAEVRR